MGDIAEYIIGLGFEDAHDNEEDDYAGTATPALARPITCKRCGKINLYWIKTKEGWRTAENGTIHVCA